MKQSRERVETVNDVISGIARRSSYKFWTKSAEEISQELWVKVLEKEHQAGHELDLDLIAHICFQHIIDMQRYESRRNSVSFEAVDEMAGGVPDSARETTFLMCSRFENPEDCIDKILINDLINRFPKGSPERTFFEYKASSVGYGNYNVKGDGINNGGYTESDLAHKLGFSGTSSRGFKNFRNRMRAIVVEFIEV